MYIWKTNGSFLDLHIFSHSQNLGIVDTIFSLFFGKNKTLIFTLAIMSKKDQQQMIEHIVANQHQRGCSSDGRALA